MSILVCVCVHMHMRGEYECVHACMHACIRNAMKVFVFKQQSVAVVSFMLRNREHTK